MFAEYTELARLQGGHTGAITAISISPRGTYLATAGTDNKICVWELSSSKILHECHGNSYALSLAWISSCEDQLVCGMNDGYVISLSFSNVSGAFLGSFSMQ